jgi:hypothetical protein
MAKDMENQQTLDALLVFLERSNAIIDHIRMRVAERDEKICDVVFGLLGSVVDAYFASQFSVGLTMPAASRDGDFLNRYIRKNLSSILWFLGRAMRSLVYVLDREMGFPECYENMKKLEEEYQPG